MVTAQVVRREQTDWRQVLGAFLAEKERRSGSESTAREYAAILYRFLRHISPHPLNEATPQQVFAFSYGVGPKQVSPKPGTVRFRLSAISSFYRFCQRMGVLDLNPVDRLQRPRLPQAPARGLSQDQIGNLFKAIPTHKPSGRRDAAITLMFLLTGRRRREVLRLVVGDIEQGDNGMYYVYRAKGGNVKRRQLPDPVVGMLHRDGMLGGRALNESLFGVTAGGYYQNLNRYFDKAGIHDRGIHILRHTAAKLRRDVGETIEQVMRFLDHSDLAVTTRYLARLEVEEDTGWQKVIDLIQPEVEGGGGAAVTP
ncbi:MAG TPA: tyrosine-type recombinase/integrase [Dehalococcoidia bacterium]|nr:tyrosine-type recombinase/integrase [Dehalococcoidia bacterium]